ncbi:hypothetical protein SAMN05216267_10108 [Actinacidiphila rubida]|uniref:ABC-2 family transporter protein n=1 Tax=Actinacidiphila rubida TaxID=310780 RepID=A0A1H8JAX3_9ACTN|nr:hypothetical protein [Actinacidiphila rubida]SEN77751.1 hypothetical protein SAMN05216267_10108 [Actinacidiphila rubida]
MDTAPATPTTEPDTDASAPLPRAARPAAPPARPPVRAWLQPPLIALIVVAAFISCYVGLARSPKPHQLPVAVVGGQLSTQVQQALGASVDVHPEPSGAAADQALKHRDVVAVLTAHGADGLSLNVAGANGLSTTTAVENVVSAYAHGAGTTVSVHDDVPLTRYDSRGLAGFYVAFGVTLSGFVLAQNVLGLSRLLHLKHRFTLMTVFAAIAGTVGATLAGPVLGAVPAPFLPLAATLALLSAAAAFTTKLLGTFFGSVGIPLATLLLLTVGNSTSGASVGADLLPSAARLVSGVLPPGAAVRAITDLSYFGGAHALVPLATLAAWAVGPALLVWARSAAGRARSRNA